MIMIHHYGYNDKSMTDDAMIGAMTFKSVQEEMLRNCKRKKILLKKPYWNRYFV